MSTLTRLRLFYLARLSQPAPDRPIYRAILRGQIRKILEIGVGSGQRALRMIELAGKRAAPARVVYAGVDLFEDRSASKGLGLKEAYRRFRAAGANVRLGPGDPYTALRHLANVLGPVDLVVIDGDVDSQSLHRAWFYLPRILRPHSLVFRQERRLDGKLTIRQVKLADIEHLAATSATVRRAA